MRILAFSSLYPPFFEGGYEIICKDVSDELLKRGHDVRVVTSRFGIKYQGQSINEDNVYRELDTIRFSKIPLYKLSSGARFEKKNIDVIRHHLKQFRPDVISVWHFASFSRAQLIYLELSGIPIVYNILDYWLLWWFYGKSVDRWFWHNKWFKVFLPKITLPDEPQILEWQPLNLRHIWFLSEHLKNEHVKAGLPVQQGKVIYNGISLDQYKIPAKREGFSLSRPFRLLYAGRLNKDKGVHTILEAMKILHNKGQRQYRLAALGNGPAGYLKELKLLIAQDGLEGHVNLVGQVPHEDLPKFYAEHDALIYPSIWNEPLGRSWQEAMACGLPVIATPVGGLKEILVDGQNSLVFSPDHPEELALKIERLSEDRELYERIKTTAYEMVSNRFNLSTMVEQIQECLKGAISEQKG
ncbi:MAG: glycosyltransferase family 4 protein [Candidatus Omnitrophica bacterium]|nr:glycosyltransferase family 4 protein [Candidatus Omnitrophota bacterium]